MARQLSLLAGCAALSTSELARVELGRGAWLDHQPNWLPDPERLLDTLTDVLPWRAMSRPMYDRIVDVPRLIVSFDRYVVPDPLVALTEQIEARYDRPIRSVGANLYRDGNDSVAWHADRVPEPADCVIAIVSLGQPRPFLLRPPDGAPVRRYVVGDGDLLTMGGTAQATCQHAVPKVRHAGERVSVMFRS